MVLSHQTGVRIPVALPASPSPPHVLTRNLFIAALALYGSGGCGGGSSCPIELVQNIPFYPGITVGCCGASTYRDVQISREDAEIDLAFTSQAKPPPAHAWLTSA